MRNAFVEEITKIAKKNKKIVLLVGDIGYKLFDNFQKNYPTRFYNCGVAEANMTTTAAGLALKGFTPITYTIATFNVYKRKTQVITPIMFGAAPWEAAEERKRKRKKKPKRKAAKTWWQTPENWYESNYWGKSGTGSGYVTFKGSEPKRLKDRKNQFGF